MKYEPLIFGIGGGKGGVGKSMTSANLSVIYAQMGFKVALLDLDFGAANIHTLFGVIKPEKTLGEFFSTAKSQLSDYLLPTKVPNLNFAPGSGYVPELANLKYMQKFKLIKQLRRLPYDLVILDLGAGSSYNVVDFFAMTDLGIIVTTPEPTAITNAYEFIKNVIYRALFRVFRNDERILPVLKDMSNPCNPLNIETLSDLLKHLESIDPWAKETISQMLKHFNLYILLNQAQQVSEVRLGEKLQTITKRYLSLDLHYAGMLFHEKEVGQSVYKMSPISMLSPQSLTSQSLTRIAHLLMEGCTSSKVGEPNKDSFSEQVKRVYAQAFSDYESLLIKNKRQYSNSK